MSAENCIDTTRCPCPCLPKVTLEQAVVDLVESIALQENALSHILCAESRKMDAAMKLDGLDLCKLCLLYTSPSPRDTERSRMPSSA